MSNRLKGMILCAVAIIIDVGAPLAATCAYFPAWVNRSAGATMSGMFVVLALISAIPIAKWAMAHLTSPSVWMVWGIIFVLFVALESIVHEVKIIALVGLISNLIGAGVYKVGKKLVRAEEE